MRNSPLPAATKWACHYWPMLAHWPLLSWLPSDYKTQMKFLGTMAFQRPRLKGRRCWGFPSPDLSVGTPISPLLQATVTTMWNTWIKDFISVIGHDLPCVPSSQTLVFPNKNLSIHMVFLINDIHLFSQSLPEEALPTGNSFKNSPVHAMVPSFLPSLVSMVGRRKKRTSNTA